MTAPSRAADGTIEDKGTPATGGDTVMHRVRATSIILGVITIYLTLGAVSGSQEGKKDDPPASLKKGDEVIALRVAPLQVEAKTVGTVRKGGKLIVEETQGDWLWVRSDQRRGWIEGKSVVGAKLLAWYQKLPNMFCETEKDSRRTRAKVHGIMFELIPAGPGVGTIDNSTFYGELIPGGLLSDDVNVQLGKTTDGRRPQFVKIPGARTIPLPPVEPYGAVQEGDFVLILTDVRQVCVNGQLRRPR